ncbi:calmodulin-binding receptor-like cytoplasmic kinase 3 isoform X1 [Phoenix dactylifera]|uniref:non-specific serine/threonine protein kinase n=1 Tax=Phoenix dactylifera TaxID=42345 RepID=A0A8B7CLW4_PHODC|nr:calmodulin-binding receptor-like cytoplasmic kinase 3 isoform X1 [Phoenix dactylifera]
MAPYLLVLVILVQLQWNLLAGSSATYLMDCGTDRVGYLKSTDQFEVYIGQKKAEDVGLICEELELCFRNGCSICDSNEEAWARIGREYCNRDFSVSARLESDIVSVNLLRLKGRKFLLQPLVNGTITDKLSKMSQTQEKQQHRDFDLAPDHLMLAVPGMFLLCWAILCPCFHSKRKDVSEHPVLAREMHSMDSVSSFESSTPERTPRNSLRTPPSPSRFSLSSQPSIIGPLHLSIDQIARLTQNFSSSLKIGEGGFGTVYKAELPDGQVVAIKRAKKERFADLRAEFRSEVALLTKIEHRNLVKLLGYTDNGNERIIITEYVSNGTLREHLDGKGGRILDFSQRLEIAIDVAHGLTYLHLYAEKPIIHRDVKSSNILLTESYRAKVADFGFARTGPMEADQTHIETKVKGTAGYVDPEYLRTYRLTPKSDVYSFGILLLEILSVRRPVEVKRKADERITVRWAFNKYNEGNVRGILDPLLKEVVDEEVLKRIFGLAFQCAAPTRTDRPAMKEVVEQLWEIRKDYARSRRRA